MSWMCWFAGHKWVPGLDAEYEQCERCPKVRISQRRSLPKGTRPCPYPNCKGWVAQPPSRLYRDGKEFYRFLRDTECLHCKGSIRWERFPDQFGHFGPWPDPTAREPGNEI